MKPRVSRRSPLGAARRSRAFRSLAGRLALLASLCRLLPACGDVDACTSDADCIYQTGSGSSPRCESLSLGECDGVDHCSVESVCRSRCSGSSCDGSCDVVSRCIAN